MYEMIEKGKRGGMCQVSHKYAKANDKYMRDYDKHIVSSYISYLDANNLYGLAMGMKLPYKNLNWRKPPSINSILNYMDGDTGYFFRGWFRIPKTTTRLSL